MVKLVLRAAAVALAVASIAHPVGAPAQTTEQKAADPKDAARSEAMRRRIDEIAEVGRMLTGPAANPECVWLGRRVISLLWRDDLDTAFRHLDLYDRFGCPGGHVQATFRCLIRHGDVDAKAPDALNSRIQACWINPTLKTQPAAASEPPGTTSR